MVAFEIGVQVAPVSFAHLHDDFHGIGIPVGHHVHSYDVANGHAL